MFSWLSDFFFTIMNFLHSSIGVSWSWAIVLLTVVVRVVLIPLTWRQIKSMRAMQALQPHVKALQEKYKDDRERLNQELMKFYRENKVSPFASCLPLLLQLPVFLGLYYMLRNQGSVNGYIDAGSFSTVWHAQPVSWLWIGDITKFSLVLMALYILSQFASSWQMSRKSAGQQRMIAFIMPLVVGIFMYTGQWPAGLMIYWFTSNLWSIGQQFVAEKIMPVPAAAAAILEKDEAAAARKKGVAKTTGGKPVAGTGGKPSGGQTAKDTGRQAKTKTQPSSATVESGAKSGGKSIAKRKRKKR